MKRRSFFTRVFGGALASVPFFVPARQKPSSFVSAERKPPPIGIGPGTEIVTIEEQKRHLWPVPGIKSKEITFRAEAHITFRYHVGVRRVKHVAIHIQDRIDDGRTIRAALRGMIHNRISIILRHYFPSMPYDLFGDEEWTAVTYSHDPINNEFIWDIEVRDGEQGKPVVQV